MSAYVYSQHTNWTSGRVVAFRLKVAPVRIRILPPLLFLHKLKKSPSSPLHCNCEQKLRSFRKIYRTNYCANNDTGWCGTWRNHHDWPASGTKQGPLDWVHSLTPRNRSEEVPSTLEWLQMHNYESSQWKEPIGCIRYISTSPRHHWTLHNKPLFPSLHAVQ